MAMKKCVCVHVQCQKTSNKEATITNVSEYPHISVQKEDVVGMIHDNIHDMIPTFSELLISHNTCNRL